MSHLFYEKMHLICRYILSHLFHASAFCFYSLWKERIYNMIKKLKKTKTIFLFPYYKVQIKSGVRVSTLGHWSQGKSGNMLQNQGKSGKLEIFWKKSGKKIFIRAIFQLQWKNHLQADVCSWIVYVSQFDIFASIVKMI